MSDTEGDTPRRIHPRDPQRRTGPGRGDARAPGEQPAAAGGTSRSCGAAGTARGAAPGRSRAQPVAPGWQAPQGVAPGRLPAVPDAGARVRSAARSGLRGSAGCRPAVRVGIRSGRPARRQPDPAHGAVRTDRDRNGLDRDRAEEEVRRRQGRRPPRRRRHRRRRRRPRRRVRRREPRSRRPARARPPGPPTVTVNDTDVGQPDHRDRGEGRPERRHDLGDRRANGGGTGSGVVLTEDGYVVTNTHVVTLDGATGDATIRVTTSDGRVYDAEVVGTDPTYDLAVIKLDDASGLTPIEFARLRPTLNVGDQTIAIGAPLGLSNTVTTGIVSALNRSIEIASSAAPDSGDAQDADERRRTTRTHRRRGRARSTSTSARATDQTAHGRPSRSRSRSSRPTPRSTRATPAARSSTPRASSSASTSRSRRRAAPAASPARSASASRSRRTSSSASPTRSSRTARPRTVCSARASATRRPSRARRSPARTSPRSSPAARPRRRACRRATSSPSSTASRSPTRPTSPPRCAPLPAGSDATVTFVRDGETQTVDVTLGELGSRPHPARRAGRHPAIGSRGGVLLVRRGKRAQAREHPAVRRRTPRDPPRPALARRLGLRLRRRHRRRRPRAVEASPRPRATPRSGWSASTREATDAAAHGIPIVPQALAARASGARPVRGVVVVTHGFGDVNRYAVSGAFVVQLWHGIPLKRIGLDSAETAAQPASSPAFAGGSRGVARGACTAAAAHRIRVLPAASHLVRGRLESAFALPDERVPVTGEPRVDVLSQGTPEDRRAAARAAIDGRGRASRPDVDGSCCTRRRGATGPRSRRALDRRSGDALVDVLERVTMRCCSSARIRSARATTRRRSPPSACAGLGQRSSCPT